MPRIALVIGAAGGIGGEAAAALIRRGWKIRALTRRPRPAASGIEWVSGDAMNADDVRRAAEGARAIVHAANPPGYRDWDKLVLPMLDNTIAAARSLGARVVLPGTIYNFGPDAFPVLSEDAPQNPVSRKGALRVEMERRLEAASREGAQALILRAGDFFGPRPGGNWFSQGMVRPGKPVRSLIYPGRRGVSHAFAYLPDVGETIAMLLERELPAFARCHFAGYQITGEELAEAVAEAVGRPKIGLWRFPWPIVRPLSPFVTLFREMAEMRYLWETPVALDDARLREILRDSLPATPLVAALRETLIGLGCLPRPALDAPILGHASGSIIA